MFCIGVFRDALYAIDICDTQFDEELIASVEYVLRNRNRDIAPLEDDGNDGKRYFASILAAEGKAHGDVPSRKNFEALLGMIPQYRIDAAVSQFKRCYEVYQKHYFMLISYAADKCEETRLKINELRSVINQERDHTLKLMRKSYDEYERNFTKKQKSAAVKPLIAPNALQINPKVLPDLPGLSDPVSLSAVTAVSQVVNRTEDDIRSEMGPVIERLKQLENEHETLMDEFHDALELLGTTTALIGGDGYLDENVYEMDYSAVDPSVLDPLPFTDPYAMCFALLYLIEQENDIPWLYGSCIGMMHEVADSLPWALYEYDELEDKYWFKNAEDEGYEQLTLFNMEEERRGKQIFPDWYQRDYRWKDDDRCDARNLAQILYEETGCLMPRNLHRYDSFLKDLGKYGIRQNKAVAMLYCMIALGTKRRTKKALNLNDGFMSLLETGKVLANEEVSREELENSYAELQKELQRLRSTLHAAEKSNSDLRKKLTQQKEQSEAEHRELADLREVIFKNDADVAEEKAETSSVAFPYTVQKTTVVFGGHDTWVKAIKPLLKGDIKFVAREMKIDVSLVRYADVIWIQTNAIPHRSYYSIVDTARKYHKPIRYFTFASAAKCAEQIVENDQ